jgi:hypothetical protein
MHGLAVARDLGARVHPHTRLQSKRCATGVFRDLGGFRDPADHVPVGTGGRAENIAGAHVPRRPLTPQAQSLHHPAMDRQCFLASNAVATRKAG